MITIIDYGVGNLASVQNMLRKCGFESRFTSNAEEIINSSKLILPGVGAYDAAMQRIIDLGLDSSIKQAAKNNAIILGVCLGAQLLFEGSDEGVLSGLSLIKGRCKKFDVQTIAPLRVPHMGWSDVNFLQSSHPLADFEANYSRFYFAHSYYFMCEDSEDILANCTYGHPFTCAVSRKNVSGVQFHPEKSHTFGARLLTNFAKM